MPEDIFNIRTHADVVPLGRRASERQEIALRNLIDIWLRSNETRPWMSTFGESVEETYRAAIELKKLYADFVQSREVAKLLRRVSLTKLVLTLTRVRNRKVIATVDVLAGTYTYEGKRG